MNAPAVQEINQLHAEIFGLARTGLEKAIRIGELLTAQKAALKHGEWLPWIKANLEFSDDTARRYMVIYSRQSEIPQPAEFDLTDAYRLLAGFTDTKRASRTPSKPQPMEPVTPEQPEEQPESESEQEQPDPEDRPHIQAADVELHPATEPPVKRSRKKTVCLGLFYAQSAIESLEKIQSYDKERKEAFDFVQRWLDEHR